MSPIKTILCAAATLAALTVPALADGASAPRQERYQIADAGGVEPRETVARPRVVKRRIVHVKRATPRGRVVNARAAWPQDRWAPIKVDTRILAKPALGQRGGDTDSNAVGFIYGLGPDSPAAGRHQLIPSSRGYADHLRR